MSNPVIKIIFMCKTMSIHLLRIFINVHLLVYYISIKLSEDISQLLCIGLSNTNKSPG